MRQLLLIITMSLLLLSQCSHSNDVKRELGRIEALNQYFAQTDGVLVFPAVRMLYNELELDQIEWYGAMSEDTVAFERFLKHLGAAVFVQRDSCRTIEDLERLRKQDLEILKSLKVPQQFVSVHTKLIDRLERIQPRAIK